MTVHYITREKEMLDYICFKHYGHSSGTVEELLLEKSRPCRIWKFFACRIKDQVTYNTKAIKKIEVKSMGVNET